MAIAKPRKVEIVLTVRVPAGVSASRVRHEVSQTWYGEIYARLPTADDPFREVSLFPKWGKARIVK